MNADRRKLLHPFFPCVVVLSILLSATLQAQDNLPRATPSDLLKIDTDMVMVEVTAIDKAGNYVRHLKPEDFRLFIDGQPQKIDHFSVNDEVSQTRPLAVIFALDVSGSLKPDEITTLRSAALKFTELMKGESVFAAMAFNNEVKVVQNFTGEARKYDALDKGVLMLSRRACFTKTSQPIKRVIVVITDGFDSSSMIDSRELIRRANAAGVTVYSVTLPSFMLSASRNTERVITPLDATRIVAATGGRDFAANADDYAPVFKALAEEIRASYGLAYYPETRDGKQHQVKVEARDATISLRANRTTFLAPTK